MDALAPLSFLPLRLSRNPIAYTVSAAPDTLTDRAGLSYLLCVKKPTVYGSGEFDELITLPGREFPKRMDLGAEYYPGAEFDVALYLDDMLIRTPPRPDQSEIVTCPYLTTPYYVQTRIENAGVVVGGSLKTRPLEFGIKGCLSVDQFATWNEQFFTTYLSQSRQFLTWQPAEKWIEPNQPEYLYYLVNFSPKPAELRLRATIFYTDGTRETDTLMSLTSVSQYTVYSIPVGFAALKLAERETQLKSVHSYKVWIANESNARLSEVRTYYVSRDVEANVLYLLFANSLGGYDTLRCTGQTGRTLTPRGTTAQRAISPNYLPTSAELFSLNRFGEKSITVATGLRDGDELDYLSELTLSEDVYVVTQEGFVALLPTETTLPLRIDDEDVAGRVLSFRYAKNEPGYSNLPSAPRVPSRATQWVPTNLYCLINERGIRTGYISASKLELRYSDDNSLVMPRRSKPNTPGTDGYTPPVESAVCQVTPFVNALIEKPGTFKRNNCGDDQESTVATLTIPAGTYGAETAEQLQSRIDAALTVMDTQEYANLYGACIANPANYTATVPANHWHYRSNRPAGIGIYNAQQPWGNSWDRAGSSGPYCFPQGSNGLDFPTTPDSYYWFFHVYGPANTPFTCKIYRNGVLVNTWSRTFGRSGAEHLAVFNNQQGGQLFQPASGDRIYILLSY